MRNIILYIATSNDGFIAKEDGDTSWLHDAAFHIEGEDFGYGKVLNTCDTILMGNATYKTVLGFDMPFPYPNHINFVFTRNKPQEQQPFVTFIDDAPAEFVSSLKKQTGKDIWLVGGGQINQLLLDAGLIDKIILTTVPTTLKKGIPLFAGDGNLSRYKTVENTSYANGFVQTTYLR